MSGRKLNWILCPKTCFKYLEPYAADLKIESFSLFQWNQHVKSFWKQGLMPQYIQCHSIQKHPKKNQTQEIIFFSHKGKCIKLLICIKFHQISWSSWELINWVYIHKIAIPYLQEYAQKKHIHLQGYSNFKAKIGNRNYCYNPCSGLQKIFDLVELVLN